MKASIKSIPYIELTLQRTHLSIQNTSSKANPVNLTHLQLYCSHIRCCTVRPLEITKLLAYANVVNDIRTK